MGEQVLKVRRLAIALVLWVMYIRLLKIQKFECVAENNNSSSGTTLSVNTHDYKPSWKVAISAVLTDLEQRSIGKMGM